MGVSWGGPTLASVQLHGEHQSTLFCVRSLESSVALQKGCYRCKFGEGGERASEREGEREFLRGEEKAGRTNVTMTSYPPLPRWQVVDSSVGADYVSRLHKGQAACLERLRKLADGKNVGGGGGNLDISPVPFFDMEVAGVYPLRS